jgi:hypothetical protein
MQQRIQSHLNNQTPLHTRRSEIQIPQPYGCLLEQAESRNIKHETIRRSFTQGCKAVISKSQALEHSTLNKGPSSPFACAYVESRNLNPDPKSHRIWYDVVKKKQLWLELVFLMVHLPPGYTYEVSASNCRSDKFRASNYRSDKFRASKYICIHPFRYAFVP